VVGRIVDDRVVRSCSIVNRIVDGRVLRNMIPATFDVQERDRVEAALPDLLLSRRGRPTSTPLALSKPKRRWISGW